jgi:hypothetical protein
MILFFAAGDESTFDRNPVSDMHRCRGCRDWGCFNASNGGQGTHHGILEPVGTLKTGYPCIQALSQGKEQGVYPRAATQASRGSSGAATCHAAPAPAAQPGAAPGPPRVP